MKTIQKIAFVLASVFLMYQTYQLMSTLVRETGQEFPWFVNFIFAFLLNLFATGIFAFVGFAFPTHRLLPRKYYSIKNPTALSRWHRLLGVGLFRTGLMLAFWGKAKNRKKYFNGTRMGIENFVYQTKQSEFGHLAALIAIGLLSVILLYHQYHLMTLLTNGINFIGNFYPIILQRHHRMRLGTLN